MSGYQPPQRRDAFQTYGKALRLAAEPAFVAALLFLAGVPWWGFILLLVLWLPLALIRLRKLRDEWVS